MKYLLILLLFAPVSLVSFVFAQSEFESLEASKFQIISEINKLQDSLKKIEAKIQDITQKELHQKEISGSKLSFTSKTSTSVFLKKEPSVSSSTVATLPKDTPITINGYVKGNDIGYFWVVNFENQTRYVRDETIIETVAMQVYKKSIQLKNEEAKQNDLEERRSEREAKQRAEIEKRRELIEARLNAEAEKRREKEKAEAEKQKVEAEKRRQSLYSTFGKEIGEKLFKGYYWLGMTDEMTKASLGSPSDINRSVGSWGVHEQWVYRSRKLYLYFENGILKSYQN